MEVEEEVEDEDGRGGNEEGGEGFAEEVAVDDAGAGVPEGAEGGKEGEGPDGVGPEEVEVGLSIGEAEEVVLDGFAFERGKVVAGEHAEGEEDEEGEEAH